MWFGVHNIHLRFKMLIFTRLKNYKQWRVQGCLGYNFLGMQCDLVKLPPQQSQVLLCCSQFFSCIWVISIEFSSHGVKETFWEHWIEIVKPKLDFSTDKKITRLHDKTRIKRLKSTTMVVSTDSIRNQKSRKRLSFQSVQPKSLPSNLSDITLLPQVHLTCQWSLNKLLSIFFPDLWANIVNLNRLFLFSKLTHTWHGMAFCDDLFM